MKNKFIPNILIAPGPYKECLSSFQVAESMKEGVEEVIPTAKILLRPLSDGGTGITRVLTEVTSGSIEKTLVKGPLGEEIESFFGLLGDNKTAVVESAAAAGLSLVPKDKRNPLLTSTYGVGQLILRAIEKGVKRIIVGCGDSATNDCGVGCATALGVKFYSRKNSSSLEFPKGLDLSEIEKIDYEDSKEKLSHINIIIACNLTSVLCGVGGISRVYAPQKGATSKGVEILENGVNHFADLVYREEGIDISYVPGAGGAGGLAASLYTFFNAKLLYSIDVIDSYVKLDKYLSKSDIVLTGEGQIDDRTATGKVVCGLALKAKKYNLPVVAIVGSIASEHEDIFYNGVDAVESISDGPITLNKSIINARELIKNATVRVLRFIFNINIKGI